MKMKMNLAKLYKMWKNRVISRATYFNLILG